MLSTRPKKRSECRGKKIAGRANASASKIVTVGSVSQVGIEESIKGSENHPNKKRQRVIQDSIVVDKGRKSPGKRSGSNCARRIAPLAILVFLASRCRWQRQR